MGDFINILFILNYTIYKGDKMFRLKELRKENGLKRSEFARAVKLPATTIANYENETRQAPYELLIVFSDFFGVTIDYLLGKISDFETTEKKEINAPLLKQNEKELLQYFRKCSPKGKSRVSEFAKIWANFEMQSDD